MVETADRETLELRRSALDHLWMSNRDWIQMAEEEEPLIIVEGNGLRVTDSTGETWMDANGGLTSLHVGYGRSEIAEAVREQMSRITYFPQSTVTEPVVRLAEKLAQITPGSLERLWPVTGGSEANETGIKIARAYHQRRGESSRYKVISRRGSYHGASGGVLWLGGRGNTGRSDFEPPYPGMIYAPQPDPYRCELGGQTPSECAVRCAGAIEELIELHDPKTVAAVIAEPVAGPGMVPGDEYWPMVRRICDTYGVVLIADEVITGFGRTGKMFGMEHWDVVPDIMTMAKGLSSSYLPVGGAIAKREIADAFAGEDNIFRQALTFGGHPATAAAALKNIEIIEDEQLVRNAAVTGAYLLEQLRALYDEHSIIGDVGGIGLYQSVELVRDRQTKEPFPPEANLAERLTEEFLRQRLIIRAGNDRINFTPPLCVTASEVDEIVNGADRALSQVGNELSLRG